MGSRPTRPVKGEQCGSSTGTQHEDNREDVSSKKDCEPQQTTTDTDDTETILKTIFKTGSNTTDNLHKERPVTAQDIKEQSNDGNESQDTEFTDSGVNNERLENEDQNGDKCKSDQITEDSDTKHSNENANSGETKSLEIVDEESTTAINNEIENQNSNELLDSHTQRNVDLVPGTVSNTVPVDDDTNEKSQNMTTISDKDEHAFNRTTDKGHSATAVGAIDEKQQENHVESLIGESPILTSGKNGLSNAELDGDQCKSDKITDYTDTSEKANSGETKPLKIVAEESNNDIDNKTGCDQVTYHPDQSESGSASEVGDVCTENDITDKECTDDDSKETLKIRLANLKRENEDLKEKMYKEERNELCRIVSERISDNTPDVADLSDMNRPTKLAERYSEVYTNEWSDAFESLENDTRNDRQIIHLLLNILTDVYKLCKSKADDDLEKLKKTVGNFSGETEMSEDLRVSVKRLKDKRKKNFEKALATLIESSNEVAAKFVPDQSEREGNVSKYIALVTELCWLMCLQDPPIYMNTHFKKGKPFRKDVYFEYTATGKENDYLVWPSLFLYKDGPLLRKGIAQPKCSKKKKHTYTHRSDK